MCRNRPKKCSTDYVFPWIMRKPTVVLKTGAFSVEVLNQEILNAK